jgi:hypothetical protein
MRVRDQARDALGRAGRAEHARPFERAAAALGGLRELLEALVQRPLDHALGHAKEARAQPLVEPAHARLGRDRADHAQAAADAAHGGRARAPLFELQPRLHDPDRVRAGRSDDAGDGGRGEVHERGLAPAVEVLRDQLLAVPVREEVDASRGDDADERGAEALEEGSWGLVSVDVAARASERSRTA